MYILKNKTTGKTIGIINAEQLGVLVNELEEESLTDKDYWLHKSILASFKDIELVSMLEKAFGTHDEIEICWDIE